MYIIINSTCALLKINKGFENYVKPKILLKTFSNN